MGYDPIKSFDPVMGVARMPNVLVVPVSSDIKTLKDLITKAKARPGHMTYSSGGNGSAAHTTIELLKMRAGIFVSHIPYPGAAPSVSDVIKRLNEAANAGLQRPEVAKSLTSEGAVPLGGAPQSFGELIAREIPRWREVVKASGMTLD